MEKDRLEKDREVACSILYVAFGFAPNPWSVEIEKCVRNKQSEVNELVFKVSPCARKYEYSFNTLRVHLGDGVKMRIPIGGFRG